MVHKLLKKKTLLLGVLFFIVSLFLYTINLDKITSGFHGDEAELALFSETVLANGFKTLIGVGQHNHPIISFFPQAFSFLIFGENIFAARLPSAIFSTLGVVVFYLFSLRFFNVRIAIFSTILFLTSHLWIAMSRMLINSQVVVFEILTFYFLLLAIKSKSLVYFAIVGALSSLMFYLYAGFRIVPVVVFLVLIKEIILNKEKGKIFIGLVISFCFFLIIASPQINFFLNNKNSFTNRANDIYIFSNSFEVTQYRESTYPNMGSLKILTEQARKTFMLTASGDTSGQYGYPNRPLDNIIFFLFILGFLISIIRIQEIKYLLLVLSLLLTLIFGNVLTVSPFFLPRATGALPIFFLMGGVTFDYFYILSKRLNPRNRIYIFVAVLALLTTAVYSLKIYFYDSEKFMYGDPNKYSATKIADYLSRKNQNYQAVFLTSPSLHAGFSTIRFLAPYSSTVDIDNPNTYIPITVNKTIFVIYPNYKYKIEEIRKANPTGQLLAEKNNFGDIQYYIYKVE